MLILGENTQKILLQNLEQLKDSLNSNQIQICVIGIGRIGLPTALSFAKSGLNVIGVDINSNLVESVNSGNFPLQDEPGFKEIFDEVMKKKNFHVITNIEEAVPKSDIILLSLPTPMDKNNVPNYSAIESVAKKLNKLLNPYSIVVVESTVEPGFIENTFCKILEEGGRLNAGKNFGLGVCPENANPGEILKDFETLPRLVGGINETSRKIITEIYGHVFSVKLVKMPDCKTANTVKLTTNVFRYVNIAFINELALLCEKLGIDIMKVIEAANLKYNFQIHYPGPGVGGPCLPVNSYQILNSAKSFDNKLLKIVQLSTEINEGMSNHVIELTKDAFKEIHKTLEKSTILILGISYKPNVKDIQITPAESVIEKLRKNGVNVKIYDPFFKSKKVFNIIAEDDFEKAISNSDAIILITAHKEFEDLDPTHLASKMKSPIIIDTRGVIDFHAAKKAGLIIRGIGRGK